MNVRTTQEDSRIQVSELITLRDDIQNAERELAGKANALGYSLDVKERRLRHLKIVSWVQASLNPVSLLTKSLTAVLEQIRGRKTSAPLTRKLVKVTEEMVFWGSVLNGLTKAAAATNPLGAILLVTDVEASLTLKAMELRKLGQIEATEKAMEYFWNASLEFKRISPVVMEELNREIDRWQS